MHLYSVTSRWFTCGGIFKISFFRTNREAVEMLLQHGADPDLEVDGSENLRDVIAANIDNFDFAAYADKVSEGMKWVR